MDKTVSVSAVLDTFDRFAQELLTAGETTPAAIAATRAALHGWLDRTPAADQLVPFDKEIPPDGEQVVMTDGNRYYLSTRNQLHRLAGREGRFIPANYGAGAHVTHWLRLPKLPREVQKNEDNKCR